MTAYEAPVQRHEMIAAMGGLGLKPVLSFAEGGNRRLAKDFERTIESATAWLYLASVQQITRRIASL